MNKNESVVFVWPFVGVGVRWCLFSLSLSFFFVFFKKKIQTFGLQKFGTKMIWTFGIKMKNEKKSEKKKRKERKDTRQKKQKTSQKKSIIIIKKKDKATLLSRFCSSSF